MWKIIDNFLENIAICLHKLRYALRAIEEIDYAADIVDYKIVIVDGKKEYIGITEKEKL